MNMERRNGKMDGAHTKVLGGTGRNRNLKKHLQIQNICAILMEEQTFCLFAGRAQILKREAREQGKWNIG